MEKKERVAIVTSGGGMKCAYAAGALVALAKKLGITKPDIFISASGSVGAMFYYLTGQYGDIERIWNRYLPSTPVVTLFPPRFNVDYLVDTVLRQELPLDEEALSKTEAKWFVPVTDLTTGHTRFISNDTWFDPYEIMRAAKAIPLLYGGAVRLGATSYIDGDTSVNMAALIHKAREAGATKILCISNTVKSTGFLRWFIRVYAAFSSPMIRTLVLNDIRRAEFDRLPGDVEVIVVGPTYPLPQDSRLPIGANSRKHSIWARMTL